MPISKKYKCLFIHIPKTGGTSIEAALGILGNWKIEDRDSLFGEIQSEELKNYDYISHFLQHLTYEQCQNITPVDKNYRSFSFIRNPWDRMVSIYSNMDNNLVSMAKRQKINLNDLSFTEFIETIDKLEHIHLVPQYKFIYNKKEKLCIDFIGRFESFQKDFNALCNQLNKKIELPHINRSQHKPYRDYYSQKTKKIIAKKYKKDIELFGYVY